MSQQQHSIPCTLRESSSFLTPPSLQQLPDSSSLQKLPEPSPTPPWGLCQVKEASLGLHNRELWLPTLSEHGLSAPHTKCHQTPHHSHHTAQRSGTC